MNKYLMMLLAVGVSGVAISAELATQGDASTKPQMKMQQHFKQLDQDGNGLVSREEASARAAKKFDAIDANKDGQLSDAEHRDHAKARWAQHREHSQAKMKARWEKIDANHDGLLSREEATASPRLAERFDKLDADKNGQVSAQEFTEHMKSHRGGHHGAKRC